MTDITMPKLSDTMTEGRLISWKKSVGERVERGEIIAEVETDKANMELEAFATGVLLEQRVKPGAIVVVGTVIGVIGAAGEAVAARPAPAAVDATAAPEPWQPPAVESLVGGGILPERVFDQQDAPAVVTAAPLTGAAEKASPLVRRMARERGIDLAQLHGTGPDGRILQEDLDRFLADHGPTGGREKEAAAPAPAAPENEPLTRMRSAIARITAESWRSTPHFFITQEIEMAEAEEVVRELRASGRDGSLNTLIIKACATVLIKFPRLNASFAGDRIVVNPSINIGFAVAMEDGLLVPVIKRCQELSLLEIVMEGQRLAERARNGTINQEEISGGTFSVSNLGMYGVDEFAAVILPPQAAILAVGAVTDRPVVKGGGLTAARIMRVTLSCDHRLVDGAYAAQFLGELKRVLENPVTLLL